MLTELGEPALDLVISPRVAPRPGLGLTMLLWIVCVVLATAGVVTYWRGQLDRAYFVDEGIYTYVGWSWLQGEWPYRDVWDHKGPTVYLATMARVAMAGTNARFLGAQEIVIGVTMAVLLAAIAGVLWGRIGPPVALAFGVLVWAERPLVDFGTSGADPAHVHMSTPGSLIALFSTAAIVCALLAVRGRPAHTGSLACLGGLFGGLALCTKLNAVAGLVVAIGLIVTGAWGRPWAHRIWLVGLTLLGALLPLAAFALLFLSVGVLPQFADIYFTYNSIRGGLGYSPGAWLFLPLQIARNLHYAGVATVTLAVLALAGMAAARRVFAPRSQVTFALSGFEILVPVWLLLELGVWLTNGGAYAFRVYPVLPAAALGATWLVVVAARRPTAGFGLALTIFLLVAVPWTLALDPLHARVRQVTPEWNTIVRDLARTTGENDRVLSLNSWRAPSIMSLAQRGSASRYMLPLPVSTLGYASDARWGEILQRVESATPPSIILLGRTGAGPEADAHPELERALQTLDHPDVRSALVDRTVYPSREQLKLAITRQYVLEQCAGEICLLRRRE